MFNLLGIFDNLTPMNWEVIKSSLNILWQGMLAIFIVIACIILAVKFLSFCIEKAEKAKERKLQNDNSNENNL